MCPSERIYLDYNATAPLRPAVREALTAAFDILGNPSSVHRYGRAARRLIEDARERVADLAGAGPEDVVFTSGGTEANDLALNGCGRERVVVSAVEHDSVRAAAPAGECIPVDAQGVVDLAAIERLLQADGRPVLVSVMLANNETGVIQPVAAIADIAHRYGALVHCDAVQGAGRLPIRRADLGVDYLTLSAHKLGGPAGIGALVRAPGAPLAPRLLGGGQERRLRSGTENLLGIAGFGAAAADAGMAEQPRLERLRNRLENMIATSVPQARFHGEGAPRLANTSCIGLPGVAAETQVMALDLAGIAVSAGAACSSGKVGPSRVLRAMGVAEADAASAIRVSFGWASREADVNSLVRAWTDLHRRSLARAA